ncbi:MAG TPA: glycerophosphodiester phosphodiesterase family protein [Gemmatimonadales bacterium]|nr:glycerophosphodiester phosphodiesterase family protein [Gemmatimonadales bacterium]
MPYYSVHALLDLSARPVIAHRGASADAPENTLAAFELAVRQGADALELDLRLSRDGVPVALHDPTLDRTTPLRGPVAAFTMVELEAAGVPSLADVLAAFPRTPLLLDVKDAAAQTAVRDVLLARGAAARCVVAAEETCALGAFRGAPFVTGACGEDIARLYWSSALRRPPATVGYGLLSVPLRHRGLPVPTRWFVAAARRLGCPVHVWTVDAPALARRLWSRGVAGIVTNVPAAIRAAR